MHDPRSWAWLHVAVALVLFGTPRHAAAGECHLLGGGTAGVAIFGSKEARPSSAALVAGCASDPVLWRDGRLQIELQATSYWVGIGTGVRWDVGDRWMVYAGTGAGDLHADIEWQADGLVSFLLQAGIGRRIGERWRADVRWHHVSNGGIREPNPGLNGIMVLFGRRW